MQIHFTVGRLVSVIAGLAAVALAWFFLAPAPLGGSTSYVITEGVSMQPRFHDGDLALVRSGGDYQVGEIVAYRSRVLHTIVLHRIVGRDGARYLFKGDHNDFVDPERPVAGQLVGTLWLRVPAVGRAFTWLKRPSHSALVAGVAALLVFGPWFGLRLRRRRQTPRPRRERPPAAASPIASEAARTLLTLGLLAAVVFGLLALIGYRHHSTRTIDVAGAYLQQGTYAYSARTRPSAIYPAGAVTTGTPVFVRLVHRIRLSFRYRFESELPHAVFGSAGLQATLLSGAGWRALLAGGASQRFRGDSHAVSLQLDLDALERTIARYYATTGVRSDTFTVIVTPTVQVHGVVAGQALANLFAPLPLALALDSDLLRPVQATPSGPTPGASRFRTTMAGTLKRTVPRTVTLLGAHVNVTTLRRLGWIGGLSAILVALVATAALAAAGRGNELTRIQWSHGSAIVPIASAPSMPAGGYVDVPSFENLAHLAESYNRVILHHDEGGSHTFYIDDDSSIYRYRLQPTSENYAAAPATSRVPFHD